MDATGMGHKGHVGSWKQDTKARKAALDPGLTLLRAVQAQDVHPVPSDQAAATARLGLGPPVSSISPPADAPAPTALPVF